GALLRVRAAHVGKRDRLAREPAPGCLDAELLICRVPTRPAKRLDCGLTRPDADGAAPRRSRRRRNPAGTARLRVRARRGGNRAAHGCRSIMTGQHTNSVALAALATALRAGEWIDLTPRIENGMPRWPTHPPVVVHPTVTHEHDGYFNQTVFMSEHT